VPWLAGHRSGAAWIQIRHHSRPDPQFQLTQVSREFRLKLPIIKFKETFCSAAREGWSGIIVTECSTQVG
jgi:hypothetical protein